MGKFFCGIVAGLFAGLLAGLSLANFPSLSPVDSESYSADGFVYLRFGETRYEFSPEVAEAIGTDLVTSARLATHN